VLDDNGDIEVDVPVDVNLVAAMGALDFALLERHALYKLDPVSDAHADRRQAVKKNWFALTNMALETALLAAFEPCLALLHMQEFHAITPSRITIWTVALSRMNRAHNLINNFFMFTHRYFFSRFAHYLSLEDRTIVHGGER